MTASSRTARLTLAHLLIGGAAVIAGTARAQPAIDGLLDEALYGAPLAADGVGDYVGAAAWDLDRLHVTHDTEHLYLIFTVAGDLSSESRPRYVLYVDTTGDSAGATFDAWGRNVVVDPPHRPEFSIHTLVNQPPYDAADTELWTWKGTGWTRTGQVAAAALATSATGSTIEWQIRLSDLGNPRQIWIELYSTGANAADNAQDTINLPANDWNAPSGPQQWTARATLACSTPYDLSTAFPDAGVPDAGVPDAGPPDTGPADAGAPASGSYVPSRTTESQLPLAWRGTDCVFIRPHAAGSADLTDGSDLLAIGRAADNWHRATSICSYIRFQVREPSTEATIGFNRDGENENAIVWFESGWRHDRAAAGITTVFFIDKTGHAQDGRILDADVEINGQTFRYGTNGAAGLTDVENTITHELGHVLGLDHPCHDGTRNPHPTDNAGQLIPNCLPIAALSQRMRDTTMFNFADPGETKKRSPEADDIFAVCTTYPPARRSGQCTPVVLQGDSGCDLGRTPPAAPATWPAWILLGLAVGLGGLRLTRRRARG